jgi:hypothetical protein
MGKRDLPVLQLSLLIPGKDFAWQHKTHHGRHHNEGHDRPESMLFQKFCPGLHLLCRLLF